MSRTGIDFWTDETSVFFTSFWGWSPENWGTVGWTGDKGRSRRANLLRELTDPFITVVYATSNKDYIAPDLKGKIAGFYLMSHEMGDRHQFTHPLHHNRDVDKWRHSLKALRAFSYLPEHRLAVADLNPDLLPKARTVAAMGVLITDRREIALLQNTPWIEVPVYSASSPAPDAEEPFAAGGRVRAGPENQGGYVVSPAAQDLRRQLYVLRLDGDTAAYLGRSCDGCAIYKVGLSVSPELRRQNFQNSMPRGSFRWQVYRATERSGLESCASFDAAVAGEDAMKCHLAANSQWLGGEFYLATDKDIEIAWKRGHAAAKLFGRKK